MNKLINKKLPLLILIPLLGLLAGNLFSDDVIPTSTNTGFFGDVLFNGSPAPIGSLVDAYDPQGVHCGTIKVGDVIDSVGIFGIMPVYGDDSQTPGVDEGANSGNVITLKINGRTAVYDTGDSIWNDQDTNQVAISATGLIDFELLPFENVQVVTPPDTVASFSVGVLNLGDGLDFYGVTSTSGLGWTTINQDSASYALSGDTAFVGFDVIVPPFGSEKIDTINFSVFSHLDTTLKLDMAFVIKGINDSNLVISFTMVQIPADTAGVPGDTLSLTLGIRNDNPDAQITDYYCVASSSAHNWETISADLVTVAVGDTGYLAFDVVIPNQINTLYDTVSYTVYSKLDTLQRFDSSVVVAIIFETNTVMTVVETPARDTAFVGETVRFMVGVRNDGPSVDIYTMSSSSSKGWATVSSDSTFNSSGNIAYTYFDVTLPANSNRLMDTITYTVSSLIDPTQTFTASVELLSVTDTIYAFSVVDLPTSQSGIVGDTVRFSIGIRNDGNFSNFFGIASNSSSGWTIRVNDSLTLNPTEIGYFDLDVVIPALAIDTSDIISINIFSYLDTTLTYQDILQIFNLITDVEDDPKSGLPLSFKVSQNYPNPFNPSTTIPFSLPSRSNVSIAIINLLGQMVDDIDLGSKSAGEFAIEYDASHLASGIYLYQIRTDFGAETRKMVLIK